MVHDQGEIIGKHYSVSLVYIHNLNPKLVIFNQDKLFRRPNHPWESLFLDNGMDVPIIIRVITGSLYPVTLKYWLFLIEYTLYNLHLLYNNLI